MSKESIPAVVGVEGSVPRIHLTGDYQEYFKNNLAIRLPKLDEVDQTRSKKKLTNGLKIRLSISKACIINEVFSCVDQQQPDILNESNKIDFLGLLGLLEKQKADEMTSCMKEASHKNWVLQQPKLLRMKRQRRKTRGQDEYTRRRRPKSKKSKKSKKKSALPYSKKQQSNEEAIVKLKQCKNVIVRLQRLTRRDVLREQAKLKKLNPKTEECVSSRPITGHDCIIQTPVVEMYDIRHSPEMAKYFTTK